MSLAAGLQARPLPLAPFWIRKHGCHGAKKQTDAHPFPTPYPPHQLPEADTTASTPLRPRPDFLIHIRRRRLTIQEVPRWKQGEGDLSRNKATKSHVRYGSKTSQEEIANGTTSAGIGLPALLFSGTYGRTVIVGLERFPAVWFLR